MTWNPEIDTDAIDADELNELVARYPQTCNGWAFAYAEEHGDHDVVVKDAMVDGSQEHCFVFDRTLGVTIDGRLGPNTPDAEERPVAGAWDGDRHPHLNTTDEILEWESREAFDEHYLAHGRAASPFYH